MQETISFTPQLLCFFHRRDAVADSRRADRGCGHDRTAQATAKRKASVTLAIGSLSTSLLLSLFAFAHVVAGWAHGVAVRETVNFTWFQVGVSNVDLGWVLDPLSAVMLVMVSFVGLLIFIYSIGYMKHDENFTRFFCFMSLFSGAMLGVVIANSLLLLFHVLGVSRTHLLLIDRILVSEAGGGRGGQEGLFDYTGRRCILSAGNCLAICANRHTAFL
jgi:hypothetical protein